MLLTIVRIWMLRHGDPVEIFPETGFNKGMVLRWARGLRIKLLAFPVRRHNKTGPVEHKHRVIKDALELLDNDHAVVHHTLNFINCSELEYFKRYWMDFGAP